VPPTPAVRLSPGNRYLLRARRLCKPEGIEFMCTRLAGVAAGFQAGAGATVEPQRQTGQTGCEAASGMRSGRPDREPITEDKSHDRARPPFPR
jgi:hypothetical protein